MYELENEIQAEKKKKKVGNLLRYRKYLFLRKFKMTCG